MSSVCRFDESLPILIKVIGNELGPDALEKGVVLRDASGCLAFFAAHELDDAETDRIAGRLRDVLGAYARPDRVFAGNNAPGARRILSDPNVKLLDFESNRIRYLDRRIVGADWLRTPVARYAPPLRIAFASLKGGVGRSTAISVLAAARARAGGNVLVVDLDLEAPGIGSLLLDEDEEPSFGVIDYLVESNLDNVDDALIAEMVQASRLVQGGGLVHIVPAAGKKSAQRPENYLAKLSRAVVEGVSDTGTVSLADKIGGMLSRLETRGTNYELVLLDVRAGLAEIAAGPLLTLGARVLLFGSSQPQTINDLRFLLAHFRSLVESGSGSPWDMLKMVHAKSTKKGAEDFREKCWELFTEYVYEEDASTEGFNFDPNDKYAPHHPIRIPLELAYADWDPVHSSQSPDEKLEERTFGDLLQYVEEEIKMSRSK